MRIIPVVLFTLLAAPAFAQGWQSYVNHRFDYSIDIPPGFERQGTSDNGAGQAFAADGRPIELLVWGGNLTGGFESEVSQRMAWNTEAAWNITYQATTPRWASWSGTKGSRMLYQRLVLLCDGTSYAAFRAEYSVTDSADMDAAVERLALSLRGDSC